MYTPDRPLNPPDFGGYENPEKEALITLIKEYEELAEVFCVWDRNINRHKACVRLIKYLENKLKNL